MKKLVLILLFFLITAVMTADALAGDSTLSMSVLVSSHSVEIGQQLEIACLVKNDLDASVVIVPDRYAYSILHVVLTEKDGKRPATVRKMLGSIGLRPESFLELGLGGAAAMRLRAVVREATLTDVTLDKAPKVSGTFIEFRDSAILVNRGTTYRLQCRMTGIDDDRRFGEDYGFKNIWLGEALSEPVELTIK